MKNNNDYLSRLIARAVAQVKDALGFEGAFLDYDEYKDMVEERAILLWRDDVRRQTLKNIKQRL